MSVDGLRERFERVEEQVRGAMEALAQPPVELVGRVEAARSLASEERWGAAHRLMEEAAALAGTLLEVQEERGEAPDPLTLRIDRLLQGALDRFVAEELEPRALRIAARTVARKLNDASFQRLVEEVVQGQLGVWMEGEAFRRGVEVGVDKALEDPVRLSAMARSEAVSEAIAEALVELKDREARAARPGGGSGRVRGVSPSSGRRPRPPGSRGVRPGRPGAGQGG